MTAVLSRGLRWQNLSRVTLAVSLLSAPAVVSGQDRAFGTNEADALGRALIANQIAAYGQVRNPMWDAVIDSVLSTLQRGVGYPVLRINHVVVGNSEQNAAAIPGHSIIVNAGLMRFLQDLSGVGGKAPAARKSAFKAFLASVLSHEIAHITLGHTDSLLATVSRLATTAGIPESLLANPLSYRSIVQDTSISLEMLEHSRERELAADRVGALYLLRAGWTIQTAMDLFRALDSLERKDPDFYKTVSYVQTHPRSSTREAELEGFRAQLKLLQADYDDAVSLIRTDVALPAAVALLDTVLSYFPEMLPALHTRGTAYHQMWLETVPVPVQKVRASLITYNFRFLPMIRGVPGDLSLYRAAETDYHSVMAREPLAVTSVQLALLEAYAGDCTAAIQHARSAASDSLSASVANNRGAVLLLCGRPTEALQLFRRAQRLAGTTPVPSLVFNLARAMKDAGDPQAPTLFKRYLSFDGASEWAAEARRQLGMDLTTQTAQATSHLSPTPEIQGITLGDSVAKVLGRWGTPAALNGDTIRVMSFPSRGVSIAVAPNGGVVMIALQTRAAGSVDGIRVGDAVSVARATWGIPAEQDENDLIFDRGTWAVVTRSRGSQIGILLIMSHD